ncbi:MAG TPA: NUDIX domain-containing protein [Candidatus Paceibacterota bacterium]
MEKVPNNSESREKEKVFYGGIAMLYRMRGGEREYLVVENTETGNISFVSGAQEDTDASAEAGMQRELEEELSVRRGEIALTPTDVRHEFVFGPKKKERAGHPGSYQVFLADVTNISDSISHTKELRGVRWLRKDEVLDALTFPDVKDVFLKATAISG